MYKPRLVAAVAAVVLAHPIVANAAAAGGGGTLPWDAPLTTGGRAISTGYWVLTPCIKA